MKILPLFLLLNCAHVAVAPRAPASSTLTLPSLRSGCALEKTWVGLVPRLPEGVVLKCNDVELLVTSPGNLYRHVSLRATDDALQFVPLFTTPETYRFFELDGMVELVPGQVTDLSEFNVVDPKTFAERLTTATVREITGEGDQVRTFHITRTVVAAQKVFEIQEVVTQHGIYSLLSKRELVGDASTIGVLHVGDV